MQYMNKKYTGIRITTHGSRIRGAQGMTADIAVNDIDLNGDASKEGTIGSVNATINWTNEGIRQSLNDALKEAIDEYLDGSIFGFMSDWISTDQVVSSVKTDPSAGTITAEAMFDSNISVKPETTSDGGIRLVIQNFQLGGGLDLMSQDELQQKLDAKTSKLTGNDYNIRVDSLEVLNDSVVGKFSAHDVTIPNSDGGGGGQSGGCEGL